MADEKSDHSDNTSSTVTSPLQQKEYVGASTHVLSDNRDIGEMRDKCDEVTSLLQSNSPEKVDGGPMAPEVGGSTEASSKSKGSHKTKKAVLPRVKTFHGQNPGSKTARNYSRSDNNVGSVLTAEVGGSTEARSDSNGSHKNKNVVLPRVKTFHGRNPGSKATGSYSRSKNNVGGVLTAEVGGSTEARSDSNGSHKNKNVVLPRVKTFYGRNPGSKAAGSYSRSENNVGGVLTAEVGGSTEARPNSLGSHKNKNVVLPRVKTFHGRNPDFKAAGSYSRYENTVGGVLTAEVGGSTEARSNSKGSHKNKNVALPRVKTFHGRNPGSKTAGSYSRSENNVGGISSQDQVISGSMGNGLAQASNASVGPCLKRSGTQPPPIIARAVRGRTIFHPSVPASFQAAPSVAYPTQTARVPSQAPTAASLPSLHRNLELLRNLYRHLSLTFPVQTTHPPESQTAASLQSLPRTPALPSPIQTDHSPSHLAQETPLLHISLDLNETPAAIGEDCFLCQKDVSMKPEGEGPDVPRVTCVLPCHHCYHAQCLESITPAEQSQDPPCIQCQINKTEDDINDIVAAAAGDSD